MPNVNMLPLQGTLVDNSSTATTTSGTSAAVSMPLAQSYRLLLEVDTVSGTSPTLDVFVATSADGGTTYQEILHFAQVTTSGQGRQMIFRPFVGNNESAAEAASAVVGTADNATGSTAIAQNGPIDPQHVKVRWVEGGTSPSFAWALKFIAQPAGLLGS